jgi:hypothetical protein
VTGDVAAVDHTLERERLTVGLSADDAGDGDDDSDGSHRCRGTPHTVYV